MKKAILIDRDGTLIEEVGYLKLLEDIRFTHKATQALQIFSELGFLNLIITNQSAVARGMLSPRELKKIHKKLKSLAREDDAAIDDLFFCPHYPEGRVSPYNVECDCRKPKPGMVLQAKTKHKLLLEESYLVGDKVTDLELAKNAAVRGVLVLTGYGKQTQEKWQEYVPVFPNLYEFAVSLRKGELV
jgi:D-glycero-D-manno-heptose 1,7-bisphosphate phosphatase